MPLFYQHIIDDYTKLGIWKIEETESFFLEKVPVKKEVQHPYKRLQHLAGRYLLPTLYEDFPLEEIQIADTLKPYLENERYHFSISHCGNYAAAIVSRRSRVGVDIELVTPRIRAISHKFLDEDEKRFLSDWEDLTKIHLELTTVLWSCKEAIYKWHGLGGLDFRNHMELSGPLTFGPQEFVSIPFMFLKDRQIPLTLRARIFEPLVLAWVCT